MSVRIRVYPQNGLGGVNGLGYGTGAVSAQTFYTQKLQSQQQVSNLQLGYERALWNERLDKVRLEERLKNPYAQMGMGLTGAYGVPVTGLATGIPIGGVPYGGLPTGYGGYGAGIGGSGQTNITNQTSTGAAAQTVTNSNVTNLSSVQQPYGGYPFGGFGGGGLLSGLLGALI